MSNTLEGSPIARDTSFLDSSQEFILTMFQVRYSIFYLAELCDSAVRNRCPRERIGGGRHFRVYLFLVNAKFKNMSSNTMRDTRSGSTREIFLVQVFFGEIFGA